MNFWGLLQWWNLVFILPFTAGLIYLLFMCSGLVSSDHDADVDGGVDHDIGVDHDVDLDQDLDVDHDVDLDHDADLDQDAGADSDGGDSSFLRALSFLGLGKAPLSILFTSFCFLWGFSGWAANAVFSNIFPWPSVFIWPSLATALMASVLFTRWLARLFSRYMPTTETYGTTNVQLIGKTAEALFNITERFGMARTVDDAGNLHDVYCRVKPGREEIRKQSKVVLMEYNQADNFFYVKENPLTYGVQQSTGGKA